MNFKERKVYHDEQVVNEAELLNAVKVKLASSYRSEMRNDVRFYFHGDTDRIVAIQTSPRCLAICANTRGETKYGEDKTSYVLGNKYNPSFVLLTAGEYNQKLMDDITLLARIVKSAGDLCLYAFEGKRLVVGEFDYDPEYKVPNHLLYDSKYNRHNIKSIAVLSRDLNKVKLQLSNPKGNFNFRHEYEIESLQIVNNHATFAYQCKKEKEFNLKEQEVSKKEVAILEKTR